MQAAFSEIQNYKQAIKEVREQLDENYFNNKGLLKNIEKSQTQIALLLSSLEKAQKQKEARQHILLNKISPHPHRKPKDAVILSPPSQPIGLEQEQTKMKAFVKENCCLQLTLHPIRIHPVILLNSAGGGSHLIPECRLKLLLYHADKRAETAYFRYTKHRIQNFDYPNTKLEPIHVEHMVTSTNFILMAELLREKVFIFLENEFKLMIAMCVLSPGQILAQDSSSISSSMLSFKMIGTDLEMLTLEAEVSLRKLVISPQFTDLLDKMHLKRVVINQHTRSRSPSPTLHKQTAFSLMRTQTRRVVIMNNRPISIPIGREDIQHEDSDTKIVIASTVNITWPSVETKTEGDALTVRITAKLQNEDEDGRLELKLASLVIKVTVKNIKILTFISLDKSKLLFKSDPDCQKLNGIIMLTENVYIRPNMALRIQETPIEQKAVANSMLRYFCKTQFNPDHFQVYPAKFKEASRVEKGVNVVYSLNTEWLRNRKQVKIVIAARAKARLIKKTNLLEEASQKMQDKDNKEAVVRKQQQLYSEYYIEIYVIKHEIMGLPDPEVSLGMEVDDVTGILMKNSRYVVESTNDNIIHIITQQFTADEQTSKQATLMNFQLMQPITITEEVLLLLHDLTRMTMTTIRLQLTEKEYWTRRS